MSLSRKSEWLNANQLKWIAIVAMMLDHFAAIILTPLLETMPLSLESMSVLYGIIIVLRLVGRFAFPLFAFLIVNGYFHTSNKVRYLMRLSIFAILSEPFFDFGLKGLFMDWNYQNVFFTLALGLVAIWGYDTFSAKEGMFTPKGCSVIFMCVATAFYIRSDYDIYGVLLIVLIYLTYQKPKAFAISFISLNLVLFSANLFNVSYASQMAFQLGYQENRLGLLMTGLLYLYSNLQLAGLLAYYVIMRYNGQKGRAQNKYVFYLFYPIHLFLLGLLALFMQ